MHLLLIITILTLAFAGCARFLGSALSAVSRLVGALAVLALLGAFSY
jgi:hypothetical protein